MKTLPATDERMLKLMEWAIRSGISPHESDYLTRIGFARTNISNVRKGIQSFNKEHIRAACELTGGNANWILGLEPGMLRKEGKSPLQKLQEAVIEVEAELNRKLNTGTKKTGVLQARPRAKRGL